MLYTKGSLLITLLCAIPCICDTQHIGEDLKDLSHEIGQKLTPSAPRVVVNEFTDKSIIEVAVPGLVPSDLKVTVEHLDGETARVIIICDTKKKETYIDAGRKYPYKSVTQTNFEERVRIKHLVAVKDTHAELKNGILTVVLPKATPLRKQVHAIPVHTIPVK